jgi:hypothetical protein
VTCYGDHLAGGGVPLVSEPGGNELVDESGERHEEDEPDQRHEDTLDPVQMRLRRGADRVALAMLRAGLPSLPRTRLPGSRVNTISR